MEDLQQALQGVLENPEMMQKIMGMAQALGGESPVPSPAPSGESSPELSQLTELAGLLGQAEIDLDQQNLLKALNPYLSGSRIGKLRRAMEAARMAELAAGILSKGSGSHV